MQNQKDNGSSPSYFGLLVGLLTIAFIVLKLCGAVNWSWGWVLSPLWIYAILIVVGGIIIGIIGAGFEIRKRKQQQMYLRRYENSMKGDKHDGGGTQHNGEH